MIIFFIRRFNDIDHLTPIVYKLREETEREVLILCLNPTYDIENDIRLKFLREKHGVIVKYAYEAYQPTIFHRMLSYFICSKYNFRSKSNSIFTCLFYLSLKLFRKYLHHFVYHHFIVNNYFGEEWARGLFTEHRASMLVFDFAKNRQYIVRSLIGAAKRLKIPTVAIPPGAMLYADRLGPLKRFEDYGLPGYDYLVMQHEIRRDLTVKIGGPSKNTLLLGVARFCQEWENVLWEIIPRTISRKEGQYRKLKVLYVDRPVDINMDKERIVEMIRKVSELKFILLLIKPHSRSNRLRWDELKMYGKIVPDLDSVELIRWADLVIGTTSSILLEAFCQNKTVLYPKYVSKNTMLFEKMGACWQVNNLPELVDALKKIRADINFKPYSNKDVNRLLTKVVYAGDRDRDILGGYKDFLLEKERAWNHIGTS